MPTLTIDEDRESFRRVVREFLAKSSPEAEVRRLMEGTEGHDRTVWSRLAQELGVQGLGVPEQYGGQGCGLRESTVFMEEAGRALLPAPYLGSVALAARLLVLTDDAEARETHLPGIVAGRTIATLAVLEQGGDWAPEGVQLRADGDGPTALLSGRKAYVLDGHLADLVLVVARTPSGIGVYAVDPTSAGITRRVLTTMDQTRPLASLQLSQVPGVRVDGGGGWELVERVLQYAAVELAAEQIGGAQALLDMTVDHVKTRFQFGRAIGSFQVVKHRLADMVMLVESARSSVHYAAAVADEEPHDLALVSSLARVACSDAYVRVALDSIQLHGGIGFTWEHPAHLYLKRAKGSQVLFGDPAHHREVIAELLEL